MDHAETDHLEDDLTPGNPDDVAVLYSWAKLQGARYRDFAPARRAYRAQLRQRAAEKTGEEERAAQQDAEAAAAATERAAREAEEEARRHEYAARRALESQAGRAVVAEQEAASERAMLAAAELARRASMERIEAARRAEAVAAAEAAARREEQEILAARASAQRHAAHYAESSRRHRALTGPQPDEADVSVRDPYEGYQASPRPDRIYAQPHTLPEDDMRPFRFRSSRDNGRYIVTQPDGTEPDGAPRVFPAPHSEAEAADVAASGKTEPPSPEPPPFVERRARPRVAPGIIFNSAEEQLPTSAPEASVSEPPYRPSEAEINYNRARMSESRAKREAYNASIAPPLAGRLSSGIRMPRPDPRVEARAQEEFAPLRRQPEPEPQADRRKFDTPEYQPDLRDPSRVERRSRPRPDLSSVPIRSIRPQSEAEEMEKRAPQRMEPAAPPAAPAVERRPVARPDYDSDSSIQPVRPVAAAQEPETEQPVPAWLYNQPSSMTHVPVAEPAARPASKAVAAPAPVSPVDDTLQHQRERVASRWFALKGVFDQGSAEPEEATPRVTRPPVLTVFSLAGGVGKTSLIATMGRALSAAGERVLITDTTSAGLLPYYFGASELRDGVVRTFTPPEGSADAPISLVSYDVPGRTRETGAKDWFVEELSQQTRGMQRILVDLGANMAWVGRRLARMNSTMLVPVAPDMNSVISLQGVERFFSGMADAEGRPIRPLYLLNQFDTALPLHLDVREVMRQQLGDRLLPFVIRRSPSVAEALAEGMTVMDYAPEAPIAADYAGLAAWLRAHAAPAAVGLRNARWSER